MENIMTTKTPIIKRIKSIRISKRTWYRGKNKGSRLIRSDDNKKCCLGFFCLQAGVPRKLLVDMPTPVDVEETGVKIPQLVANKHNTTVTRALMACNDDTLLPDSERSLEMRKLFKRIGVRVIFTK